MTTLTLGEADPDRTLWAVSGPDTLSFLQGLVTNDLRPLETAPGMVWCAILSPQGKYLADFFMVHRQDGIRLIDIATRLAEATFRRLSMYRLRANVQIVPSALHVRRGIGTPPEGAIADPRHPALGWRAWTETPGPAKVIDWDAIRVTNVIPESGIELQPDETYILEAGFERLQGVDFKKGCYVGQEVTARMKHKTELKKGLVRVVVEGSAPVGTEITSGEKTVGRLFTQSNGYGIAHLRFDQASGELQAGTARLWRE